MGYIQLILLRKHGAKEKYYDKLSDPARDYFNRMVAAAGRMQSLIHDLLSFSRLNSADRKFEATDLNTIVEEVKKELRENIAEKHATIEVNAYADVKIIPFQFRQLMQNLIANALKFSKPDTPLQITITSENIKYDKVNISHLPPQKEYCHITVMDNGIGFENEFSEKIFEVFQKLHRGNVYAGTGIGLAIVKKIVENHNGAVTATGELGKGARFDIYIPA